MLRRPPSYLMLFAYKLRIVRCGWFSTSIQKMGFFADVEGFYRLRCYIIVSFLFLFWWIVRGVRLRLFEDASTITPSNTKRIISNINSSGGLFF